MSWTAALVLSCALSFASALPISAWAETPESDAPPSVRSDAELEDRIRWWQQLSPREREELRGRYQEFRELPQEQQQRMRNRVKRWRQLSPRQRGRIRERHQAFRDLPRAEQTLIRDNYRRWRNLPAGEKQQLRERFKKFRALPKAERERIRKDVRGLEPKQPRRFRRPPEGLRKPSPGLRDERRPDRPRELRPGTSPRIDPSAIKPSIRLDTAPTGDRR